MRAFKLPKSTEAEQAARDQAIEAASKQASIVPLETAELAAAVARELASLEGDYHSASRVGPERGVELGGDGAARGNRERPGEPSRRPGRILAAGHRGAAGKARELRD